MASQPPNLPELPAVREKFRYYRQECFMASKLFDRAILGNAEQTLEFLGNVLEASTEYSIIGKDLTG